MNGSKNLVLAQGERAALGELEHGQESDDELLGGGLAVQQLAEGAGLVRHGKAVDRGHRQVERHAMRSHVLGLQQEGLALAVQVGADDGQAAQGNAGQIVGH